MHFSTRSRAWEPWKIALSEMRGKIKEKKPENSERNEKEEKEKQKTWRKKNQSEMEDSTEISM